MMDIEANSVPMDTVSCEGSLTSKSTWCLPSKSRVRKCGFEISLYRRGEVNEHAIQV